MVFAEIAQHAKIRAVHWGDEHEGQVFAATPLDLPGAEDAPAVGIDQDGDDLFGVIGMLAFDAIKGFNTGGIQLREQFGVEVAFMLLRQKIKDIAGKQLMLMEFNRAGFEGDGHKLSRLDFWMQLYHRLLFLMILLWFFQICTGSRPQQAISWNTGQLAILG